MHIIAIASQKGGSGKTTLAGHLAVAADKAGAGPVALVDTDPQGSLAEWWNARKSDTPLFARTVSARLAADVERMRNFGIELLIIDTPPAIEATIVEVVRLADLVIVPARPSPHDLRAVGATVEMVERLAKPLVFVLNGATPRARITSEAVMALSQHGTLAPIVIHHRTGFAASMIDGRTVMEIAGDDRSAAEIAQLWDYLARRLSRDFRTMLPNGVFAPPLAAPTDVQGGGMSVFDTASLTEMLLVAKGDAAPSRETPLRHLSVDAVRRAGRLDARVRVCLRVDEKRHRRLRLAGAHLRQSAQALLLAALDHYLDHVVPGAIEGGCRCLEAGAAPQVAQFKPPLARSP